MGRKGLRGTLAVAVLLATLPLAAGARPAAAQAPPTAWFAGAAAEKLTPPPYNPAHDLRDFPLCNTTFFNGPRLFDYEEPYVDSAGTGFFDYTQDAYCDANANGRYDGLYTSGGVARFITWVHDDIWARALAVSDGTSTVVIESITSQGLGFEDVKRIRSAVAGYTGVNHNQPPVAQVFVSSNHNESSPDPIGIYGAPVDPTGTVGLHSGIDDFYITFLVQQSALAAKEAVDALVPAHMRIGEFTPQNVRARLSTTFLTTDSNPSVNSGPLANGIGEATDTKAVVMQLVSASTGNNIETLFNWPAHNQQTGHAPSDSVAPDPNAGNTLKPINSSISDDWPGVFASTVEASIGGHAMFMVGANGSIEDPHLYPLPNPDTECPGTDFSPVRAQGTAEGCITLPHLTGNGLAIDVLGALAGTEDIAPHAVSIGSAALTIPLQNQLFIAAFGAGIFAHHTVATVVPCVDAQGAARTCFQTEVALLDLGPQLQMLTNPGEAYPALIQGHPFGKEQVSCPERAEPPTPVWHATAAHKLQMGLGDDMLGYEIPAPGWFADSAVYADNACPAGAQAMSNPSADYDQFNNYHKLESESVGPDAGNTIDTSLARLADCAAAGTLSSCSGTPALCTTGARTIASGRFLLADGTLTRRGRDNPVGMWLLPCGVTTFTPGAGTLVALTGIGQFGTTPVTAHGVFMDFDGRAQGAPDINTRGMLVTDATGGVTRYFMDPYLPLTGSSPGAAAPAVVTPEFAPGIAAVATLLLAGLALRFRVRTRRAAR